MNTFGFYRSITFCIVLLLSSVVVEGIRFSTVLITRHGDVVCSGRLEDSTTVITSATCVKHGDATEYGVLFNTDQTKPATVDERIIHNEHKYAFNNIAKLKLLRGAWYGGKPVHIQGRLSTRVYEETLMASKDALCFIVDMVNDLLYKVTLWSDAYCSRKLNMKVDDTQLCTKLIGPMKTSCPAGEGNPIICRMDWGSWVQVGIHLDKDCSRDRALVATRVSMYRPWLKHATNNVKQPDENETDTPKPTEKPKTTAKPDDKIKGNDDIPTVNGNQDPEETTTTTTVPPPVPCADDEYTCSDGTCIPDSQLCDGTVQCPCGMEDEDSCGCDLAGTEFITGFLNNVGPEVSILYITAPDGANVTVQVPVIDYNETREIIQTEKWDFDNTSMIIAEELSNKGVYISSDTPITVIAVNSREFSYSTVDGTIVYPINCLSTSYTVELQKHNFYKASQFAVIGTQPDTLVQTTSRSGAVKTKTLGLLDVYFMQGKDFRALTIQADKDVVVMSGSECGYVPSYMSTSCDHMVNQIPSNTGLGKTYIVSPQLPRKGYMYRVRAVEDGTFIQINLQNGTVSETDTIDTDTEFTRLVMDSETFSIVSNTSIMVTQYSLDAKMDGVGLGDPSMIVLQPLNQFDSTYNFIVPDHFLRVGLTIYISTCHDVSGLRLNGERLSQCGITTVDIPEVGSYHVINTEVQSLWESEVYMTLNHVDSNVRFGAMLYGSRVESAFAWRIGGKI